MLKEYTFFTIMLVFWIVCFIGSLLNWKWLVDPPEELRWHYSQSFIKYYFGSDFTKSFTVTVSILGILSTGWLILLFKGNDTILTVYYTVIISIICIYFITIIIKKVKQAIIDNKPIPDYYITDDGKLICKNCGYKQPKGASCINCGHKFEKDTK